MIQAWRIIEHMTQVALLLPISEMWRCTCSPIELHCLDVEPQCWTDGGDVFIVEPLNDGCLASVV